MSAQPTAQTMALLPAPDVCQECACVHAPAEPHNRDSLYYQLRFHRAHGRLPGWSDAMSHCSALVQAEWRAVLVEVLRELDQPIPPDLAEEK